MIYPASGAIYRTSALVYYPGHSWGMRLMRRTSAGDRLCPQFGVNLVNLVDPVSDGNSAATALPVRCVRDLIGRVSASERMT